MTQEQTTTEIQLEQSENLSKAIDRAIAIENQGLINELHICLQATIKLNKRISDGNL